MLKSVKNSTLRKTHYTSKMFIYTTIVVLYLATLLTHAIQVHMEVHLETETTILFPSMLLAMGVSAIVEMYHIVIFIVLFMKHAARRSEKSRENLIMNNLLFLPTLWTWCLVTSVQLQYAVPASLLLYLIGAFIEIYNDILDLRKKLTMLTKVEVDTEAQKK